MRYLRCLLWHSTGGGRQMKGKETYQIVVLQSDDEIQRDWVNNLGWIGRKVSLRT